MPAFAEPQPDFEVGVWLNRHIMAEGEEAIVSFLDDARERGLTSVYPNFWFHGYVIYPGSDLARQHPDFEGKDVLGFVLAEAKKRDLKVHPWGEYGFFTHYNWTNDQEDVGYILEANPDWKVLSKDGSVSLKNEKQGFAHYSMNPAHPQARKFLADIHLEVVRKYPEVDGIHLDRIRYQDVDYSYDTHTLSQFQEKHGFDPRTIQEDDEQKHRAWNEWRAEQLHTFMREFSTAFREEFPGKTISAATVPPYMKHEKFQNWEIWAEEGTLDVVMPMIYGGPGLTRQETDRTLELVPDGFPVAAGLDVNMGSAPLLEAVKYAKENGAVGVVLWDDVALRKSSVRFDGGAAGAEAEGPAEGRPEGRDLY